MTKAKALSTQQPISGAPKKAGDIEYFSFGRQTYLAPLPLPTEAEPCCPYISDYNDTYLDFGGGERMFIHIKYGWAGPSVRHA